MAATREKKKKGSGVNSVKNEEEKSVSNTQKDKKKPDRTRQDSITRSQCRQEEGKSRLLGERFITFTFTQNLETPPEGRRSTRQTSSHTNINGEKFVTAGLFSPSHELQSGEWTATETKTTLSPLLKGKNNTAGKDTEAQTAITSKFMAA